MAGDSLLHEVYEQGWHIWPSLEAWGEWVLGAEAGAQTVGEIARSQDSYARRQTRAYMRQRLIARVPARKYSSTLEEVLDTTLTQFYGESMVSTTDRPAHKLATQQALRADQAAIEIGKELRGTAFDQLPGFLLEAIWPKYSDELELAVLNQAIIQAISSLVLAGLLTIPSQEAIMAAFAPLKLHEIRQGILDFAQAQGYIPQTHEAPRPAQIHPLSPWRRNVPELLTNRLRIQQVARSNYLQTLLINTKEASEAYTVQLHNNDGFPDSLHQEIIEQLVSPQHVPQLIEVLKKHFA